MFAVRLTRRASGARPMIARHTRRYQSSQAGSTTTSPFAAGVAGGLVGAGLLYGIYQTTPTAKMARKINAGVREAEKKYEQAAATIKDKTPTTDEALDKLKQFCYSYASWVPGGRQYVDKAFDDLAVIRESHSDEVDQLVKDTYREFQSVARSGFSLESASKVFDAMANLAKKIASLSVNVADQILERHPQLNDTVGEPIRKLKDMGTQYGPEAKKLVDETWSQVNDIMASGFSVESADKVRKVIDERTQQVRKIGDKLWDKSLEQAKPYFDKAPRVKELITGNSDLLKQGNITKLFEQIKSLGDGGDMAKLEDGVKRAIENAKAMGSKTASMASGASFEGLKEFLGSASEDAGRKLQDNIGALSEAVSKHEEEGKELLEETKEDLRKVLADKAKKAHDIVDGVKREAKQ